MLARFPDDLRMANPRKASSAGTQFGALAVSRQSAASAAASRLTVTKPRPPFRIAHDPPRTIEYAAQLGVDEYRERF